MIKILINSGFNIGIPNKALEFSMFYPNDRPCYPSLVAGNDYWFLCDEAHESLGCQYSISYHNPNWIISIGDKDQAMLFKLRWGGL